MRISSLAIVFQSASLFVATIAVQITSHETSQKKEFVCNRRIIGEDEFSKPPQRKITEIIDNGGPVSVADKFYELLQSVEDDKVVMYSDNDSNYFTFYSVNNLKLDNGWGNTNTLQEYILVIDEYGRVCAMILKLTVRQAMWGPASAPIFHFSLCVIDV
ncbi:BgTH12-05169 [Blumeria graminis f. sp. triticale]|uniref:BgTH12-05169 n=1 Tax=Blumeria graminis f. sp. triticale TaxID=1689686 RepID=A0A9W4D1G5_BLUGR|nr:BgTH12-05169 [Blumeria graminis f. sp. triticale]